MITAPKLPVEDASRRVRNTSHSNCKKGNLAFFVGRNTVFEGKMTDRKNSVSYVNISIAGGVMTALKSPLFLPYFKPSTYLSFLWGPFTQQMGSLHWDLKGCWLLWGSKLREALALWYTKKKKQNSNMYQKKILMLFCCLLLLLLF